jgi:Arc/MetJ-type ribon-helix-helix transcriptional regulator
MSEADRNRSEILRAAVKAVSERYQRELDKELEDEIAELGTKLTEAECKIANLECDLR